MSPSQSLCFPRKNLFDTDGVLVEGIPAQLKKAVCTASLVASEGEELFQVAENNGIVTSEHIGQISFTYDTSTKVDEKTVYESINTLLRGFYVDKSKKVISSIKVRRTL